jgi:hypothetical protein
MATCEVCGNDYDKAMQITVAGGESHTFDSFECAIHAIAPRCAHCDCAIIGHGHEAGGSTYCCAHCAREAGHPELADRADG